MFVRDTADTVPDKIPDAQVAKYDTDKQTHIKITLRFNEWVTI